MKRGRARRGRFRAGKRVGMPERENRVEEEERGNAAQGSVINLVQQEGEREGEGKRGNRNKALEKFEAFEKMTLE